MTHPNVELARRGFAAFAAGDRATIEALVDDEAVWRIPGRSDLAGEHSGRDAILAMLRQTTVRTGGSYRAVFEAALADDDRVVALYRAQGERPGRSLDIRQLLVIRIADGRWAEIDAVPFDLYAFDAFWDGAE